MIYWNTIFLVQYPLAKIIVFVYISSTMKTKKLCISIFILGVSLFLFSQDTETSKTNEAADPSTDISLDDLEAELFGDENSTLIDSERTTGENLTNDGLKIKTSLDEASILLSSEKLRFGGRLDSALVLNYLWADPYRKNENPRYAFTNPAEAALRTNLAANLFFDARPSENSKIYGKFDFGIPFEKDMSGTANINTATLAAQGVALSHLTWLPADGINIPVTASGVPNFKVRELYTDFSAKDIAFFRFGKHAVKWGVGYFYQPADVLNISRLDPQNPEAEREGAVSFRTHIIIPKTQHNIWLYLLPPGKAEAFKPQYTGGAAKAELLFGDWELGLGGFYRYEKAPRFITTLSGNIADKLSVFAEGVFAWGSDYIYHKNDKTWSSYTEKKKPFFQATLGGSYTNTKSKSTIAAQYYYNGFGYKKPYELFYPAMTIAEKIKNPETLTAAEIQRVPATMSTLQNMAAMEHIGQHYIALSFSQAKLGTDKLSLNLFQQFAISELEAMTVLTLNWHIYKFASMNTSIAFTYPLSTKSPNKGSIGWKLGFNLGGGKF